MGFLFPFFSFSLFLSLFFLFCFSSLPIFHSYLPVEETGAGYRERSGKGKKRKEDRKKERKRERKKERERERARKRKRKRNRKKLIAVNSLASLLFPSFFLFLSFSL